MSNVISLEQYKKKNEYSIKEVGCFGEYMTYRITQGNKSYDITVNIREFLNS